MTNINNIIYIFILLFIIGWYIFYLINKKSGTDILGLKNEYII